MVPAEVLTRCGGDASRARDRDSCQASADVVVSRRKVPILNDAREVMTWDDLGVGSRELAGAMHADDWIPDLVLGISRGGLLVAGGLAYALGVKNTATISVEFYTGVDERLELPMLLPPVPDLVDLTSARVLIADDVADTGATLELVRDFCAGRVAEARVAVLYEKSRSTVASEYVWRRTDRWITFPWSALPPVSGGEAE
jgi:hypoxanthine phosphoribosyltransferase